MSQHSRTQLAAVLFLVCLALAPLLNNEPNEDLLAIATELPVVAHFEIRTARGELRLSGHTVSEQHEKELSGIAASLFPDKTITTKFEPLGLVPSYWQDATAKVLYALAETSSAHAELRPEHLHIRGVFVDDIAWNARFGALQATLPTNMTVSQETILIASKTSPAQLCRSALNEFDAGDINFEDSSADFQHSAIPRLARVTAIAAICRDALIRITGHTDASGPESWNQHLSLGRASAVADFLVHHGIDRARMQLIGAGSSVAIADNASYYGRSLNRRIEIEFTAAAQ